MNMISLIGDEFFVGVILAFIPGVLLGFWFAMIIASRVKNTDVE